MTDLRASAEVRDINTDTQYGGAGNQARSNNVDAADDGGAISPSNDTSNMVNSTGGNPEKYEGSLGDAIKDVTGGNEKDFRDTRHVHAPHYSSKSWLGILFDVVKAPFVVASSIYVAAVRGIFETLFYISKAAGFHNLQNPFKNPETGHVDWKGNREFFNKVFDAPKGAYHNWRRHDVTRTSVTCDNKEQSTGNNPPTKVVPYSSFKLPEVDRDENSQNNDGGRLV